MKYLLAVSGGIDSVVLLHMMVAEGEHELTVAHFDHGIRDDSAADARFVAALAASYGLPFVGRREELGKDASEETARERRYAFLRSEAKKRKATLVTAHHANDVVETVALNLSRGTGWRGLAALDSPDIVRPLLTLFKQQIRGYALEKRLEWVEDSTNASDAYLRNRLRRRISRQLPENSQQVILDLWQKQRVLKKQIDTEVSLILEGQNKTYSRYFFTHVEPLAATELLRAIIVEITGQSVPRPQLGRMLLAIKTARAGTQFSLGSARLLFDTGSFTITVKTP